MTGRDGLGVPCKPRLRPPATCATKAMLAVADGAVIKGGGALVGVEKPAPQQGRAAPDGGDVDWPAPAASQPAAAELPEFAKKADDVEAIKKAVDDAASVSGALWFSYLFVLFYLAVAAGAVTHADLFLENPVKLPFLGVELPLLAFFFIAPILFLVVHAYVLVHLVMLTDKAKRFHEELHKQFGKETGLSDEKAKNIRDGLRQQLPSNIFVQFLAGAPEARSGPFGWALRAIGWTTLVVGPVLLLLMMQIQFLPYHSSFVAWTQRLALLADLTLIWWLWGRVLSGRDPDVGSFSYWPLGAIGLVLGCAALMFSWLVATFPGEWQDDLPSQRLFWFPFPKPGYDIVTLNRLVFQSDFSETTGRRQLPFSNTLVLVGFDIYENLKIDDPEKLKRNSTFHARGRELRGAIFERANLARVDFAFAHLEGALLDGAILLGAQLGCDIILHNRSRGCAHLKGASLEGALLQGTLLHSADLQGATLDNAQLQGATLDNAQLQGASLNGAWLQGASLGGARLQGATLKDARLGSASLAGARLLGASLDRAQLQGATLDGAQLQGALLDTADLTAADLSNAYLWRTKLGSGAQSLKFAKADKTWQPVWADAETFVEYQPWNVVAYEQLSKISDALPPAVRKRFLANIQTLDCASNDPGLSSCDLSRPPPPEAAEWQKRFEEAHRDDRDYANALASKLKTVVCTGESDAIYILRGNGLQNRLSHAGAAAPALVDDIMGKSKTNDICPVSASLTENDKARLLRIRQQAAEQAIKEAGAQLGFQ